MRNHLYILKIAVILRWSPVEWNRSYNRPLSRRLDRCDRVIQNESRDPFGGNVYVTMQITFLTRKFRNRERNLHCDVVHITTKWVSSLTLDCNGVFAIKAYWKCFRALLKWLGRISVHFRLNISTRCSEFHVVNNPVRDIYVLLVWCQAGTY